MYERNKWVPSFYTLTACFDGLKDLVGPSIVKVRSDEERRPVL